jgi:uncharacterized protein with NRDE domain
MCTALFAYHAHPNYPLIILSNRDEFYHRPTKPANFWQDNPKILSGIDLEKGGTWFGVNQNGRVALLTNYRDFTKHIDAPLSRGLITKRFLSSSDEAHSFLASLQLKSNAYNPYNLVVGDINKLYYYSNMLNEYTPLAQGVHGLSNGLINDSWPKVNTACHAFKTILARDELDEAACFELLSAPTKYPLELLPDTGIDKQLEIDLSSIFIDLEQYGTRMQTIYYVDQLNNATFIEKSRDADGRWHEKRFAFKLYPQPVLP